MQQVLIAALNYSAYFGMLALVVLMYRRYAADAGHSGPKWPVIGGVIFVITSFLIGLVITILHSAIGDGLGGIELDNDGAVVNELAIMSTLTFVSIAGYILATGFAYLIAPRVLRPTAAESVAAKKRSRALQIVLVLMGVFGAVGIISNLTMNPATTAEQLGVKASPQWFRMALAAQVAVGSTSLVGILALWRWRRWGLYLLVACGIVAALTNIAMLPLPLALVGLLGTALIAWLVSRQWPEFS